MKHRDVGILQNEEREGEVNQIEASDINMANLDGVLVPLYDDRCTGFSTGSSSGPFGQLSFVAAKQTRLAQ